MKEALARASLLVGLMCVVEPANAQVSQSDRTLAQSLFEQGKQLMQAGRFADACPKLEESQRLDPGGGTMLNLALCYEDEGKISTAWADFKEALSMARRDGRPEREQASQEHIAALESKLPHLTLSVESGTPDEELLLDGAAIGKAAWGSPMSVDPGTHQLTASAPGRSTWALTVIIAVGEQKAVTVPALAGSAPAEMAAPMAAVPLAVATTPTSSSSPPSSQPSSSSGGNGKKTAGWIVAGTGVVLAGVGAVFGVQALSKRHDSDAQCPADNRCTANGVSLNDDAKTAAWVADFGVGLGIVGIGVGTYLLLTSGGSSERPPPTSGLVKNVSFDARTLPAGGEVTVGGVW